MYKISQTWEICVLFLQFKHNTSFLPWEIAISELFPFDHATFTQPLPELYKMHSHVYVCIVYDEDIVLTMISLAETGSVWQLTEQGCGAVVGDLVLLGHRYCPQS